MREDELKSAVRHRYGQLALTVLGGASASCCGTGTCEVITADLYAPEEAAALPQQALEVSLGCGNPTALAELREGETVLDLGCGGGIDVLLAAQRVGPAGKAYGLDLTDEMLALAEANKCASGLSNAEFLKGDMENIPLPDGSVDVILSNCVINLAADKDRVLREAFRVLKPGGRLAISDIVTRGAIPETVRRSVELWIGCLAGALDEADYRSRLAQAGFVDVRLEPTRIYQVEDLRQMATAAGIDPVAVPEVAGGGFFAAFISARKPAR